MFVGQDTATFQTATTNNQKPAHHVGPHLGDDFRHCLLELLGGGLVQRCGSRGRVGGHCSLACVMNDDEMMMSMLEARLF